MFSILGACKSYGDLSALSPTDLEIAPGTTTVLIGPSGCGKSTLIRLLVGLIEPTSGEVEFDGVRTTAHNLEKLRRRMGYVIQDGGLFAHLSARGNVSLLAEYIGWTVEDIQARLEELCELTHLPTTALEQYPRELSGGQKQRVSLMRALMLDPAVLLLDEPLAALDPMIRAELQRDLKEIFSRLGKTVVMVTHDMSEAAFFADTIVLMRDGRIVQRGTYQELVSQPADPFVTAFINAQRSHINSDRGAPL